ncbi:hypothetical protein BDV39DRAFT_17554 [Aspergillus sergii]|uniref:Uncharacterized protein n=1 Tax=Aspergillus sergii TaxID=1034303 RepID=A0A5N6WKS6_9EURO|nr:hypothetical protein BDV39DRAFT_17554 [Aspergillus sergii]
MGIIGSAWDCILLLDEADVFLSQRSHSDLQRNALVSVFLRVLEYYSGIIFLTTNRVGNIDEAIKSRLHMSLYYPPLNANQTQAIWKINLERLRLIEEERSKATSKEALSIDTAGILNFARELFTRQSVKWNGRQIRNAFLIASSLARFDKYTEEAQSPNNAETGTAHHSFDIRADHFKVVANAATGFDHYMHETKGKNDGEIAWLERVRADYIRKPHHEAQQMPSVTIPKALPLVIMPSRIKHITETLHPGTQTFPWGPNIIFPRTPD